MEEKNGASKEGITFLQISKMLFTADTYSGSWSSCWNWGAINFMEGYGNDNPGANAHVP
mgnify:FL=1